MQLDRTMIAGAGIGVLALSLLAMLPGQWWGANLLTNFHLHLAVAGLAILAAGAVWRRWLQVGIGVVVVAVNLGLVAGQLPASSAPGPVGLDVSTGAQSRTEKSIRVMTLNVLFANHDVASLRKRLMELNLDVVLLQ